MATNPIVLFVDDEPAVLEGIKLTQKPRYEVRVAHSGGEALEMLRAEPETAVVVSDMRMPGMDGAALLTAVRKENPDTTRVLLTGHADVEAAARAVNEGRIFRFLTKPCDAEHMARVLGEAVQMHELITAERVLLQKTLVATVRAVITLLGLNNPEAMGRAVRVRDRLRRAAQRVPVDQRWGVEFAGMFSQLAAASLPETTMRKLYAGQKLSALEQGEVIGGIESVTELLRDIPRLEPVTKTLEQLVELARGHTVSAETERRTTPDARLLHAIIDLESLESRGIAPREALAELEKDGHDRNALAALAESARCEASADVAACALENLVDGMVLGEDLRTTDGVLLLPRGFELTRSSRQHIVTRFRHRLPARIKVHIAPWGKDSRNGL